MTSSKKCIYFQHLVYIYGDMLNTVTSSTKVFQLLDRRPKMKEQGSLAPQHLKGQLALSNITFSYPSRLDVQALKVREASKRKENSHSLLQLA